MQHKMVNVGTQEEKFASCVLLREVKIYGTHYDGPGKVGAEIGDTLDGKVLGVDVPLIGNALESEYIRVPKKPKHSLGGYRLIQKK